MSIFTKDELKDYKEAKRFLGFEIGKLVVWIILISFMIGGISLVYKSTIKRQEINIQRKNFEQSKSRLHGIADDLAKYKYELRTEEDKMARKAIIELIIDRTSSLNVNDLEDDSLRNFVNDIKNGRIR